LKMLEISRGTKLGIRVTRLPVSSTRVAAKRRSLAGEHLKSDYQCPVRELIYPEASAAPLGMPFPSGGK
jgi:hypothetical protein